MPAYTLSRRTMPDDMQTAIAAFIGPIQRHATGKRTLTPAIASAPNRGATRDDTRAALSGLITLATPQRRKPLK